MIKKTRKPKRQGIAVVKYNWRFRMLRNQAIQYFARKDREVRRTLRGALRKARNYTDVELAIRDNTVTSKGPTPSWHEFMNHFFKATVNKRMRLRS